MVVPCSSSPTSLSAKPKRAAASVTPVSRPMLGSSGVVGVFQATTAPLRASRICRSVKVPPISTAMRTGRDIDQPMIFGSQVAMPGNNISSSTASI